MNHTVRTSYQWIVWCFECDEDQVITYEKAGRIAEFLFDHAGLKVTAGYVYDTWIQLQED